MLRLKCKSQNYAWGKMGLESLVGQIHKVNNPDDADIDGNPFAEFWMGDHVNGPSHVLVDKADANLVAVIGDEKFIDENAGQEVPVSKLFELNNAKFLGKSYLDTLAAADKSLTTSLSYLFKVLSVNKALSIQAHPNKDLAAKLHVTRPDKYKDPNHKPEMAIAVSDDFKAMYGFL